MLRKLSVLAALCWLMLAPPVFAVGLGEIVVRSTLNQPFSASIPLINVSPADAEELRVGLASSDAFAQAGIERLDYLSSLRFEVRTQGISSRIIISSSRIARDPFLNFLIDVRVGDNHFQREYIVLLDPPPAGAVEPVDRAIVEPEPAAAEVLAPARPAPASAARPAFSEPPAEPVAALAPPVVFSGEESRGRYGPVKNGESFWSIATRLRPPPPATLDQTMLAIFEINPQAFPGGIDSLRKGSTLKVPTAERVAATDPVMARDRLRALRGLPPLAPAEPAAAQPAAGAASAEDEDADLTVPAAESTANPPADPDAQAAPVSEAQPEFPDANPDAAAAPAAETAPSRSTPQLKLKAISLPVLPWDTTALEALPLNVLLLCLFLLLMLLLILFVRRRRERERSEIPPMQRMIPSSAVVAAAGRQPGGGAAAMAVAPTATESLRTISAEMPLAEAEAEPATPAPETRQEPSIAAEPAQPEAPVEPVPETKSQPEPEPEPVVAAADPLAEAELNLAYGQHNEAIAVLMKAIAREPERLDLQIRLAETYFAAGRKGRFQQLAATLQPQLSAAKWDKLASLGRQLLPEAALFAVTVEPEPEPPPAPVPPAAPVEQQVQPSPAVVEPASAPVPEPAPPAASAPQPLNLLELDLKSFDMAMPKPAPRPGASERPPGFDEIRLEDFDFDEPQEAESISDGDESGTKLDLARAYADMGDDDMARSLLTEVLALGNADQQQEAQNLLTRLKS